MYNTSISWLMVNNDLQVMSLDISPSDNRLVMFLVLTVKWIIWVCTANVHIRGKKLSSNNIICKKNISIIRQSFIQYKNYCENISFKTIFEETCKLFKNWGLKTLINLIAYFLFYWRKKWIYEIAMLPVSLCVPLTKLNFIVGLGF
jgi:hypothetical protein